MLLRPDEKTNWVLADVLGGVARKYEVALYAASFVSTHGHVIVGAHERLDKVQQDLKSQIAKRLNIDRDRVGVFFQRKKPTPILSDAAFLDRLRYTHSQPVHHGLVECVEDWPGLSSYRAFVEGRDSFGASWFDEPAWREAGGDPEARGGFVHVANVPLSLPPQWQGVDPSELERQRAGHEASVRDREREQTAARRTEGAPALPDPSHYQSISPFSRPRGPVQRRPAPLAHGSREEVEDYRRRYRIVVALYRVCSAYYRTTGRLCPFPRGTHPPRIEVPFEFA